MSTILVASYGDGTASLTNATSAYNAASAGDTIQFPLNGSATWSAPLTIGKVLTIDGNGTTLTGSGAMSGGFFTFGIFTSTTLMRITGFTFNLSGTAGQVLFFTPGVDLTQFRFDHNICNKGASLAEFRGMKGVVDNNYLYNMQTFFVFNAGTRAQADASWASMVPGTSDMLCVESNHFTIDGNWAGSSGGNDSLFDTNNGGKLTFRYNIVDISTAPITTQTWWMIQEHGNALGGAHGNDPTWGYWQRDLTETGARRGQSIVEIYNNTLSGKFHPAWFISRGSSNIVHDNTITSTQGTPYVYLREEEAYETSNWSPVRTSWPAEDQVHNTFFWNNTYNGSGDSDSTVTVEPASATFIQKDRDYFLHAPQSSGGKESFTGANGAAGSAPTDGSTYVTLGTMTFSGTGANAYYPYTAYTYPHPLAGTAVSDPTCSPVAGSYVGSQSVALSCSTSGASIRYTTDGSTPSDTVGTVYSGVITVAATLTIKAIAYKTGLTNSNVVSAAYVITAAPIRFTNMTVTTLRLGSA